MGGGTQMRKGGAEVIELELRYPQTGRKEQKEQVRKDTEGMERPRGSVRPRCRE